MSGSLFADPAQARARVRIALPVPIDSLFDYRVPSEMEDDAQVGCRVRVSFSGRSLTGVIVECLSEDQASPTPEDQLSLLEKVLDPEPVLSPEMIRMLGEAAEEVLCPVGIALATALPPGSAPRLVSRLTPTPRGREALERGVLSGDARDVICDLARAPRSQASLARRFPGAQKLILQLERDRLIERTRVESRPVAKARVERIVSVSPELDVEAICSGSLARAHKQASLLRRIARAGDISIATLRDEDRNAPNQVRSLAQRGYVVMAERAAPRDVLGPAEPGDRPPELTPEQAGALVPIRKSIREKLADRYLLHGVTGSGKTEVYLQAVSEALEQGRQALLLVPEITLTHQLVARLRARFGDRLAVLHSGLSPGERLEQWQRLAAGDTPIAVGARSAIFAPLDDLGVIVIDEEHDSAYKNEEGFRYRAHGLAGRLAREMGCPLILGSATPALETRFAADSGELQRLVLSERIAGRPLPRVEIVDMVREHDIATKGKRPVLTASLRRALAETLEQNAQTILFLNRRGFSTQIYCFECGHAERCHACEVALVFHASESRLRCHYCDFSKPPPQQCGGCGVPGTSLLGMGTERLEEEVRTLHPGARIARLDRDTSQRRGHTASVLKSLREREVDILIGTQMVAKGHDFPGVRLVGIVAADTGLHMPDFRAAERSFQLLTQVAGRAGRAGESGRVVLQTFVPDHYAIQPVGQHDYETFYATELEYRRGLSYPPFGRITQLVISSPDEALALRTAEELARLVRPATVPGPGAGEKATSCEPDGRTPSPRFEVLGPAPAPLARLRGRYRFALIVKGSDAARVREASKLLSCAIARLPRSLRATLDIDPVSML